ncbi:conserved protein of unknown function [Tenacibaculum sp. 190524A02b]|uniref:hypothetical protein n=1 Tax=Tenacibaculum vairaonense TaxID=3137860 RepID=UPI0032B30B48
MLNSIKLHYNITTTILAKYLRSSYSFVNSLVVGRRQMSLPHYQALIPLHNALALKLPVTELSGAINFIEVEEKKCIEHLEKYAKKITESIEKRKETLQALELTRLNWLRGIHACNELLKTNLTQEQQHWIGLRKSHLEIRLKERSLVKVLQIQSEVNGLEAQYTFLLEEIKRLKAK